MVGRSKFFLNVFLHFCPVSRKNVILNFQPELHFEGWEQKEKNFDKKMKMRSEGNGTWIAKLCGTLWAKPFFTKNAFFEKRVFCFHTGYGHRQCFVVLTGSFHLWGVSNFSKNEKKLACP